MRLSIPHKVTVGFVSAMLMLLALTGMGIGLAQRSVESQQWVAHTYVVLDSLGGIVAGVYRASSYQRAYLLTGDQRYLLDRDDSLSQVDSRVIDVSEMTVDNPVQQARLPGLKKLIQAKLDTMIDQLAGPLGARTDAARRNVEKANSQNDSILAAVGAMQAEEQRLLSERSAAVRHEAILVRIGLGGACLVLLAFFSVLFQRIYREMGERQRAENEARALNEQLSARSQKLETTVADLDRSKEVAERAARLKDEFIGTVSHELRTPLTSITASLGLLNGTADVNRPDATNRLIAIAHANCQRLVRLVNDILDIAKLEAGKVIFDMQRVDIGSLLKQAIEACRPLAESCGVRLRFENLSPHAVHADPDRLMQVVSNLLSNAIKFTPAEAEVVVTLKDHGDNVRISVRDHGPGIPENFRHRVFEKFAQADASDARQKAGTGLGLSIVKEIVQRLDGEVGFSDAPGGGTNFFVELPHLDRIDGGDAGARILFCGFDEARMLGHISKGIGRNGNRPVRVLHLDDDPDVLAVVAQSFAADADVVSATTMENARQALAASDFDLAIVDLVLDGSLGTDLLPDLHDSAGQPIPVIVYSTRAANPGCSGQLQAALLKSPGSIDGLVAILRKRMTDIASSEVEQKEPA